MDLESENSLHFKGKFFFARFKSRKQNSKDLATGFIYFVCFEVILICWKPHQEFSQPQKMPFMMTDPARSVLLWGAPRLVTVYMGLIIKSLPKLYKERWLCNFILKYCDVWLLCIVLI